MKIEHFAEYMEQIESASGSNDKIDVLCRVLDQHSDDELVVFSRFALGELFDDPERKTHVSNGRVISAVSDYTGVEKDDIKGVIEAHGKPSYGVEFALSRQQQQGIVQPSATLEDIYELVDLLPDADGDKERDEIIQEILSNASSTTEGKWLSYCLLNDLSLGLGWKTLAKAFASYEVLNKDEVDKARNVVGTFPEVLNYYYARGELPLTPILGQPFNGMLAKGGTKASDYTDGKWMAQTKYDGARVFAHNSANDVRLFSRGRQDVTKSLPEITEDFEQTHRKMILDGEVIAYQDGEVAPFQAILQRFRRKENIDEIRQKIQVKYKIFDILMLDDEWVGDRPAHERYDMIPPQLELLPNVEIAEISNNIEEHYAEALENGHEGVIVKDWNSPWVFERDEAWQKLKPSESLDLRVCALKPGTGKHADKLGAFELETENGVHLGNVGTGFSDEEREKFDTEDMIGEIVEVVAEELQETDDGYGLRFPRFEAVRDDKQEADDIARVAEILS